MAYPNLIKIRAKQYGYTLDELAKRVHVSRRMLTNYCNGHFHIPRLLLEAIAYELQCPVETLITDDIQQQQHDYEPSVGRSDIVDRKRREVLALLGVASVALLLPPVVDWERVTATITQPSLLDKAFLSDLEAINLSYWGVYRTSARKGIALDGVLGQLKTLIGFLREPASEIIHKVMRVLASDMAQLAGEIWFDADEYALAQSCYSFAADAAKEARHYDLWACALVRHAFLPIYEQNFHDALPLLEQARHLSLRGDSTLVTRQWAAAVEAEAQSRAANLAKCQDALECAYEVTHRQNGSNGRWLRFDGERLPEQTGSCYVRLQQPDLAEPALQQALRQLPTPSRRRGMVLSDLALASLQQQDIEQACTYIEQVIEVATNVPSGWLKKGIATLHHELEPFQTVSRVSQLDQQLLQLS
jgi:transcriptional regulator with XRE-family HTH domain